MIDPNELELNLCKDTLDDYRAFMKGFTKSSQDVQKLIYSCNVWVSENKAQLNSIYVTLKTSSIGVKEHEFVEWARHKYYNWLFNQDNKNISDEVDNLIKGL